MPPPDLPIDREPSPITDEEAKELERLDIASSPASWSVEYGRETGYPLGIVAQDHEPGGVGCVVRKRGIGLLSSPRGKANAQIIAAARNALPRLLAELRATARAVEAAREATRVLGEAREMLSELSDYATGVRGKALVLTLDHIDELQSKLRAALDGCAGREAK